MQIQGLAAFLDSLMGGLILVSLSTVIGSMAWGLAVVRVAAAPEDVLRRCLGLMRVAALALAATQTIEVIARAGVVAGSLYQFLGMNMLAPCRSTRALRASRLL